MVGKCCPVGGLSVRVVLFGWSGGLVAPACVGAVFALLGVFVVLVRSFCFSRFGLGFGLVVRGGRWVCVSCRSGRVLSGGAVRVCRAALVRRGLLASAALVGASAFPAVPVGSPVVSSWRSVARACRFGRFGCK